MSPSLPIICAFLCVNLPCSAYALLKVQDPKVPAEKALEVAIVEAKK
jgi:hypothetical protein